jgi:hypothetical protein
MDYGTTARAKGKAVKVFCLRGIRRNNKNLGARGTDGTPNTQPAHSSCCNEISFEQSWRYTANVYVVEAMARFVWRQERRDIHIKGQQITDDIVIFRSREATQRIGAAWIRSAYSTDVKRFFEMRDESIVRGLIRPRTTNRGHKPRAEPLDDLFPNRSVPTDVFNIQRL